jgi:RNA polymerase sigma factor (sigma-70 family)
MTLGDDHSITATVEREQARLRNFVRKRVSDASEVEDILQDVFYELVEAERLVRPIERAGAWLLQVARNRIIDRFRKKRPEHRPRVENPDDHRDDARWEDLLPSPEAGPDALYARGVLMDEIEAALDELPAEQRSVFLAHEVEGRSFKDIAAETGVAVNTLLSRKHYAVLHLRRRLRAIYQEYIWR